MVKGLYSKGNKINAGKCFYSNLRNSFNLTNGRNCYYSAQSYDSGLGLKKDKTIALSLYEKACNLNFEQGCTKVGKLYVDGITVKQDTQKAKEYFFKGCISGDVEACSLINKQ